MKQDTKEKLLRENPHVQAIGEGVRTTWGKTTGEGCTVVSVEKKLPLRMLAPENKLPASVDVIESGIIRALPMSADDVYTGRYRPSPGGVSIGHKDISAGTLGCWVNHEGSKVILSNNHVLANSNDAQIGDLIIQPGPHDGGDINDAIASLSEFIPIHFLGEDTDCGFSKAVALSFNKISSLFGRKTRMRAIVPHADSNLVDAAIAMPLSTQYIDDIVLEIGKIEGTILDPFLSMPIQKVGRTTGLTSGEIIQTDVVVQVSYGNGKIAIFQDQLMGPNMSAGGDSGSLVVSDNKAVGLLFAGSDTSTILSPIEHVLNALNITI
jgi:hypothetical protein